MEKDLQVLFRRCAAYDRFAIGQIVEDMAGSLGLSGHRWHGKIVLLKPNLISAGGPGFSCTHGECIAGIASWFIDHGARVVLGDSPALGSGKKVLEKHGIFQPLSGMDIRFVEFTTPVEKKLACGVNVNIAREALECDLFVGLPKIKAHNQMYVTMALKNIFGVVKGVNKAMLHMVHGGTHDHFANIILDLQEFLPDQLHFADGIEVMHESGPLDGNSLFLGCLGGARSPVALDTAFLDLLELEAERCPLWRVARDRSMSGSAIDDIRFPALHPRDFHGSGFIAPSSLDAVRFSLWKFLRGMLKRVRLKVGERDSKHG